VNEKVTEIIHSWEKIDIVVNNACKAIFRPFGEMRMEEIESRKKIITIDWKNTMGIWMIQLFPYFMGRLFLKFTSKNQTGSIS
jgi:NADP-dependent 3-hydroxy acid dehydrogenase YdfG